ncbi:MAG: HTH-type transcriptional regulator RutR [Devosiaceae bacterium]|nr:HTH-type transcriptional regulator RutR [Devosiaceae bacterium MH13]
MRTQGAGAVNKPSRIQRNNRAAISDAAMQEFSARGYHGATIDAIAGKAGMSKPNLLYYFRSKEAIYRSVLEQIVEEWLSPLMTLDAKADPIEELRRYITLKMQMSADRPEASRLFASEIIAGAPILRDFLEGRLKTLVDEKATILKAWIAEGKLAPVDPYHLIFTIWATTQHYADFAAQIDAVTGGQPQREGFQSQATQAVLSIILGGVKPRG